MEKLNEYLSKYKGYVFAGNMLLVDHIDSLQNFEIRDSDVFLVTYPKSGTIWTQNIIMSICDSECTDKTEFPNNMKKMPWLEYPQGHADYSTRASPRFFASHLSTALMPPGLREKKPKLLCSAKNETSCSTTAFLLIGWSANMTTAILLGGLILKKNIDQDLIEYVTQH